jgi:hypothetical protein
LAVGRKSLLTKEQIQPTKLIFAPAKIPLRLSTLPKKQQAAFTYSLEYKTTYFSLFYLCASVLNPIFAPAKTLCALAFKDASHLSSTSFLRFSAVKNQ